MTGLINITLDRFALVSLNQFALMPLEGVVGNPYIDASHVYSPAQRIATYVPTSAHLFAPKDNGSHYAPDHSTIYSPPEKSSVKGSDD